MIGIMIVIGLIATYFATVNGWLGNIVQFIADVNTNIRAFWDGISNFGVFPAAVITAVVSVFAFKIIARVLGR